MISSTSLISIFSLVPLRSHCDGYSCSSIPNSFPGVSMPSFQRNKILQCKPRFGMRSFSSFSTQVKTQAVRRRVLCLAEQNDGEEKFQVVAAVRSAYNDIVIVDTPQSRMLLLDSSHNVHSILTRGEKWTGSYWLVDKAREYFALSDLEKHTPTGGILHVCIGDALSPSVNVSGGYAGIIVDLFSDGKVLPQLQEVSTWLELHDKLMPNGRFMVNCGAANDGASDSASPKLLAIDRSWVQNSTIRALCQAFPTKLNWKKMPKEEGENYIALTGPLPDLATWSAVLPDRLSSTVNQWRPCLPL